MLVAALVALTAAAVWAIIGGNGVPRQSAQEAAVNPPTHTNRLIDSASPYLLQHAHNPVDWYPWTDEALQRARREDKPIFLSIGYSACHWCHVMERESFEDEEIARILNEYFIAIKVDREERPDLDEIYMKAVQMMTGSGGWPLNVFLTPDLKPFYGGTYFPREDMGGRPGLKRVLLAVADAYREKRDEMEDSARQVTDALNASAARSAAADEEFTASVMADAVRQLEALFDSEWGGFGGPPRFPQSAAIGLLLRYHHRTGSQEALRMATLTLDRMAYGGIYDHLGGGFHRYAVDGEWLVPHFEKMLYDNAQLANVYLDAFQLTGKPLYRQVARETLDYVVREMADDGDGFHATQDADSEGEEGKYYVWTLSEVNRILSPEDAAVFRRYYGVSAAGNLEGRNILHVSTPLEEFAEQAGIAPDDLQRRLKAMGRRLLAAREKRIAPGKDDKVLADWNGLMISAFARGYQVLGADEYRRAAEGAANFILTRMRSNGRLLHAHRAGRSYVGAFLDDYAFLIDGLLDLYEATFDIKWVRQAEVLAREMIEGFWDERDGGFYASLSGQMNLIARSKSGYDSATPSGNAVAAHALLRLAKLTDTDEYFEKAGKTLAAFGGSAQRSPTAFARMLWAVDFHLGPTPEIAISGGREGQDTRKLLEAARRRYRPNKVVAFLDPRSEAAAEIAEVVPLLASRPMIDGAATAYVCENYVCKAPVTSASELERELERLLAER